MQSLTATMTNLLVRTLANTLQMTLPMKLHILQVVHSLLLKRLAAVLNSLVLEGGELSVLDGEQLKQLRLQRRQSLAHIDGVRNQIVVGTLLQQQEVFLLHFLQRFVAQSLGININRDSNVKAEQRMGGVNLANTPRCRVRRERGRFIEIMARHLHHVGIKG